MSLLDMLAVKDNEVFSGMYYAKMQQTTEDVGLPFTYESINTRDTQRSPISQNIENIGTQTSIKTRSEIKFEVKGYIQTQDKRMWRIVSITEKVENAQAFRFFKTNPQVEKILRVISVDNIVEEEEDDG